MLFNLEGLIKKAGGLPRLAALAGRSRTAVYYWRRTGDMRVSDLLKVCRAVNAKPADFFVEDKKPDEAGLAK